MSDRSVPVSVVAAVHALAARWASAPADSRAAVLVPWLAGTVLRPLREAGVAGPGESPGGDDPVAGPAPSDHEVVAAVVAELVGVVGDDPRPALLEALAGLARLAVLLAEGVLPDAVRSALATVPCPASGRVVVAEDGPYLAMGPAAEAVTTWLGEAVGPPRVVALCRCGRSGAKPWCDGSHAAVGFSGAKRADRVPDRLDLAEARAFTVTDNRGLCAHSGRCTDALPVAFRVGADPFVAPAGGRADDVLRAVQACPSGALGVALEGRRCDALADTARGPGIEVSKDGPYRLTGGVEVLDAAGAPVVRPAGSSPEHCSLCRCGQSANKPFCSGAHWHTDFHDPDPADGDGGEEPTLFAWAGGYPALLRMTRLFYERHVAADDLLAPLFARMEPDHPERVAAWLCEVFGGPEMYSQRYGGYARMIAQHVGKHLTEAQRARWITLLVRSADEALVPSDPEFRAAFTAYLEWGTRIAVENSTDGAVPPAGMPVPRWWWVCNATPAARASALPSAAPEPEPTVEAPGAGEPVGFERHVRGLFRTRDRASMRFVFDLWSHHDVTAHATAILGRLTEGTMPCDGPWPPERVAVFRRWTQDGCRS